MVGHSFQNYAARVYVGFSAAYFCFVTYLLARIYNRLDRIYTHFLKATYLCKHLRNKCPNIRFLLGHICEDLDGTGGCHVSCQLNFVYLSVVSQFLGHLSVVS